RNPLGIQVLDAERVVAHGPGLNWKQVQDLLQPSQVLSRSEGLDVDRENTPVCEIIVIEPVYAGINQADHILRTAGLSLSFVLRFVQFPYQLVERTVWKSASPQTLGDRARSAGEPRSLHWAEVRFNLNHHHCAGWARVQTGDERLIDPPAG